MGLGQKQRAIKEAVTDGVSGLMSTIRVPSRGNESDLIRAVLSTNSSLKLFVP